MIPKQKNYSVGIYLRLSKDDERAGESLSIENQRKILVNYVQEQGWNIYKEYVDDGYSGTTFDRPNMQKMLDDAKNGKINLIICKDLSRFGRNYIQVGQYTDYIFPMYNIRFIALTDNIDTANSDSASMDMMPLLNVFNEWHSANTSKKLKAVFKANAKLGKYKTTRCPYGYIKGDDANHTPIINPETAPVVVRIFEMRAKGYNYGTIARILNDEKILPPDRYYVQKFGGKYQSQSPYWRGEFVKRILHNPIYIGTLVQLKSTTISHKNHKLVKRDEADWAVIPNNHEAIISQELWKTCQEINASVSQGKRDGFGEVAPLSGLLYCDKCGCKMKQHTTGNRSTRNSERPEYICSNYANYGKKMCTSHYIKRYAIEDIVLADIRSKIDLIVDENKAKQIFLEKKLTSHTIQLFEDKRDKTELERRIAELSNLIQNIYEDKVVGKIPETVCVDLINKYQSEKERLQKQLRSISERLSEVQRDEKDVAEFIKRLKKYTGADLLTREMALELIEYIIVDDIKIDGVKNRHRKIHIYYKLLDDALVNKHNALE